MKKKEINVKRKKGMKKETKKNLTSNKVCCLIT